MRGKSSRASRKILSEPQWRLPMRSGASASELERMFLAELRTRRARLTQWLRLVELEFIHQTEEGVAKSPRRLKQRSASQVS
jgi:hypothetical protein